MKMRNNLTLGKEKMKQKPGNLGSLFESKGNVTTLF